MTDTLVATTHVLAAVHSYRRTARSMLSYSVHLAAVWAVILSALAVVAVAYPTDFSVLHLVWVALICVTASAATSLPLRGVSQLMVRHVTSGDGVLAALGEQNLHASLLRHLADTDELSTADGMLGPLHRTVSDALTRWWQQQLTTLDDTQRDTATTLAAEFDGTLVDLLHAARRL